VNKYQKESIEENLDRYWGKIETIVRGRDESRIDELRLNVALLKQYIVRKKELIQYEKFGN
jgi:hypothetical protein